MGGAAFGMRWGAQQLVKLVPGAGTLVSASVAGAGTLALGKSAVSYFVDGAGRARAETRVVRSKLAKRAIALHGLARDRLQRRLCNQPVSRVSRALVQTNEGAVICSYCFRSS